MQQVWHSSSKFIMKNLTRHILSIALIAALFIVAGVITSPGGEPHDQEYTGQDFMDLAAVDFTDSLQLAIVRESLNFFYPYQHTKIDSIIEFYSGPSLQEIVTRSEYQPLTWNKIGQIGIMYLKFVLIFILVLILSYYGAQSLAVLRFVKMRQNRSSYLNLLWDHLQSSEKISIVQIVTLFLKAVTKGILYFILFSPAYVIAYSIKTRFDTNSVIFMILLGLLSNGLLISYMQKFYTFLVNEQRKGYVQTARVKNLKDSYQRDPEGISYRSIFRLRKKFSGHVFEHIFINARYQYMSSLKEQASFLISGLVIIEMALNIQGHLCYEMLQNILYKNYQIVLFIVFCIFLLVKMTEIFSDYLIWRESRKYENLD